MTIVRNNRKNKGPWPKVATARFFLSSLVGKPPVSSEVQFIDLVQIGVEELALWVQKEGIGPLVYARYKGVWTELVDKLRGDTYSAVVESGFHTQKLLTIGEALGHMDIQTVVLKGAALASSVYEQPAQRTMSDIDFWLKDSDIPKAIKMMQTLGYRQYEKGERPFILQKLAGGEIQFYDLQGRLVEFHWSPFAGWWAHRTTNIPTKAILMRVEPLMPGIFQLDAEDMIIHLAFHLGVNHRFSLFAIRGLVDIALTAQKRHVNWIVVANRAKAWRVGTTVYMVLDLLDQLIGVKGMLEGVDEIRPSALRRSVLRRMVTPESVLAGRDVRQGWRRYALLLLLVDRPRDAARLLWRTVWPETEWLAARYGEPTGHGRHLWRLVRRRAV